MSESASAGKLCVSVYTYCDNVVDARSIYIFRLHALVLQYSLERHILLYLALFSLQHRQSLHQTCCNVYNLGYLRPIVSRLGFDFRPIPARHTSSNFLTKDI